MDEIQSDTAKICRACKNKSENMQSIFEVCQLFDESPRIDEMLMECTSIQIKADDGLPDAICSSCLNQLKNAYNFKLQCQQTESLLREQCNLNIEQVKADELELEERAANQLQESVADSDKANGDQENLSLVKADFIELIGCNQMLLTCRVCNKVFTTIDGLRGHKRLHLGTLLKCRFCGKGYTRQTHVYRHELTHGKHKLHVCKICNKTITRMEHLKRHLTTHLKQKPFNCKSCNRSFNRSDHLEVHAMRCKGERVHICDICNRGFSREDSLKVHKRLHENQIPVLPTLDNIDNIEEHYYEISHDPNADHSNASDIDEYIEPHLEVSAKYDDEEDLSNDLQNSDVTTTNEYDDNEVDVKDVILASNESDDITITEKVTKAEKDSEYAQPMECQEEVDNDVIDNDSDSCHSEYLPNRVASPKIKRGRGRPRKNPVTSKVSHSRVKKERKKILKTEGDDEEEVGEFSCPACDEVFNKMSLLDKHVKTHDGVKCHSCKICNKQFSRFNQLKRHMNSHSAVRPFQCELCNKRFSRRDHLQQHVKLHDKKHQYACDVCTKTFHREDHLAKHKLSQHTDHIKVPGEKKFDCNMCSKTFTTEKYRDIHLRGHMGEKRFQCKTCEKCFLSKSHLSEHMKFHNDEAKKFLCSECGHRFIRNDYLVIHMRRHRGEKPFKCKFCGKGFPRTTDLTVHERYHTGEKTHLCTICGRGFGRAYNLTVHMRTHTGEKPYQCTYCDAAFAQGNDLKAHVRRHTGERFQCELCSESFLMGYLLTQHKRIAHGLNVVSNIRRLQPADKIKQDEDDPPITITLPKPVIPDLVYFE